jgi:trehalose 6-phosphate phosphatase
MPDADPIIEPLRADPARAAILCDIDGTLAPIVDDPERAAVPDPARAVLRSLAGRYVLVACVSGRRASAARRIVGVDEITYLGNHGLERLDPGEIEPRLAPELGHRGGAAAGFVNRLDPRDLHGCGLRLEDKGPIQAIHWRTASDWELAQGRARELAELAAEQGLKPHFGRMVLELRPLDEIHKGTAVRSVLGDAGVDAALFGGDDTTDLDAFAALTEMVAEAELSTAVRVAVASAEGPEELQRLADVVVDGPEGFLDLLRAL